MAVAERRIACVLSGCALLALSGADAQAAAWTQPAGNGLVLFSTDWVRTNPSLFGGAAPNTQRSIKREARAYVEYGVTDWLTAIVAPELVNQHLDAPNRASFTGLGYTSLGLRGRVFHNERWVVSLEGYVAPPGPSDGANPAQAGNTGPRYQAGIDIGYGFELFGRPAFLDAGLAYRIRTGRPADEARLDLTFGIRPAERWLLLLQSFTSVTNGAGRAGFPQQSSSKLQVSVVYDWSKTWSLQLGVLQSVASRNVGS